MKRKVEALLLKLDAGNAVTALREPTLGAAIQRYIREEMPERLKSQQNYHLLWTGTFSPNGARRCSQTFAFMQSKFGSENCPTLPKPKGTSRA
jgi:hypothetical protein